MKNHKDVFSRIITVMLLLASVCMTVGCKGKEYKVKGEEKALAVYTCSNDNMFGLEKIAVFEDKVVAVFDKDECDDSEFGGLINEKHPDKIRGSVSLSNLRTYKTFADDIDIIAGKYVAVVKYEYDESNRFDMDVDVTITGINVMDRNISFNDGNLRILYSEYGGECINDFKQVYDKESNDWGKIESELILVPLMESE